MRAVRGSTAGRASGSGGVYKALLTLLVVGAILLLSSGGSSGGSSSSNLRSSNGRRKVETMLSAAGGGLRGAAGFAAVPPMLYGTAWKKERTASLVGKAIRAGFRGIDTACQPKHYNEPAVGQAVEAAIAAGVVTRSQLFLQTKFTSLSGQDPDNVPYDKDAALTDQVRQSLAASLRNLKTSYLDSWVLHSPMKSFDRTLLVWREFEEAVRAGTVRSLGISNCYELPLLKQLYEEAVVKPSFLQNRFYQKTGFDKDIRAFCKEKSIKYQTFWTLTANPDILKSATVRGLATKKKHTPEQIWFAFVLKSGMMFLTGTTSDEHMAEDLAVPSISLTQDEFDTIDALLQE